MTFRPSKRSLAFCLILVTISLIDVVAADEIPTYILSAVAHPRRPETDRERDANRKPAEVIAFAGLKRGDKVADFMPGKGYFTKIFCNVVGDNGHVYAISVPKPASSPNTKSVEDKSATPSLGACANVTAITLQSRNYPAPKKYNSSDDPGGVYEYYESRMPVESFVAPEPLDMIWTAENYHDLHNKNFGLPNMQWVDTALLAALKPGGVLIVEDHAAANGSGARDTATLHRIDVEQVKKEVTNAGFEFVAESRVLRSADDPHTAKAHDLHDKTDRFLLKFRRPLQ